MKKYFLSFGLLFTVSLATVVFNSCGDDKDELQRGVTDPDNPADSNEPDPLNPTTQLLIGIWQVINSEGMDGGYPVSKTENYTVTFNSNGKGVIKEDEFEWTKKGDLLTLTYSSNSQKTVKIIKLTETELIFDSWYDSDDGSYYYTTCKKINNNPTDPDNPADPADDPKVPIDRLTDVGVVIYGIKWATRNVDSPGTFTEKPEDPGMFYQWNNKTGWSATDPLTPSDKTSQWNSTWWPTSQVWETINNVCPSGWRIPTTSELSSLKNAGSKWTTNGRIFGGAIFLPAAGYRGTNGWYADGTLHDVGSYGCYWSNETYEAKDDYEDNQAYGLQFDNYSVYSGYSYKRNYGRSVRCVSESE